ncbi:MAG: hypothetical protein JW843_07605 [Candidatus Aminicenantes bacterium]|nr:hypothetical protein [Candidatus Aminicenantes bacterium]
MSARQTISSVALYEAKLLLRSWGFRVFAAITLAFLAIVILLIVQPAYAGFYFGRALSGALPMVVIKLLNVFQGVMAVFLATEFIRRDRRLDTVQVVFSQSFSNGQYIFGKFLGLFGLFLALDLAVIAVTIVIHVFFSTTPFALSAYLGAFALLSLPTLVFMIGLPVFLGSLLRSQPVVYLLSLSLLFLSLVIIGPGMSSTFDAFGFFIPVFHSDFNGLGPIGPLAAARGMYLLLGAALVLGSIPLLKRLPQKAGENRRIGILAVLLAAAAVGLGAGRLAGLAADRAFREEIRAESAGLINNPVPALIACDIKLKHEESRISAEADLILANRGDRPLPELILNLNPGLKVEGIRSGNESVPFRRRRHLVTVAPAAPLAPGTEIHLTIAYSGTIDERYAYLDIEDERLETPLKIWFISVPRRAAFLGRDYVLFTPESGWYPRPGLPASLLFPDRAGQEFSRYTLSVDAPASLTAVSQGLSATSPAGDRNTTVFKPETPLPQIALALGRYEKMTVAVDNVEYGLYLLRGHDRFTDQLGEIAAELPDLIRRIKDGVEVVLGLSYPFRQLALVEVPLGAAAHDRRWTTAQEFVQPELVLLPEMGVLNAGAEFRPGRGGPQAGQRVALMQRGGTEITPADIQRTLFNRFIQTNLLGSPGAVFPGLRASPFGLRIQANVQPRFNLLPQYLTYAEGLRMDEWPLLGYALEVYLGGRANPQTIRGLAVALGQGMSEQERINAFLMEHSLADALSGAAQTDIPLSAVTTEKAKYLMVLIRSKLDREDFDDRLVEFLAAHRFTSIDRKEWEEFFSGLGGLDLDGLISVWREGRGLPGFWIDDVQSYPVRDGERNRYQISFRVTNPTDLEGVLKVDFVTRGSQGMRGGGGAAVPVENRAFLVPPRTVLDVGLVLDQVAVMTTVDTVLSQNLPAVFNLPFSNRRPGPGVRPFDGVTAKPYVPATRGADGEYIVDNEDEGFRLPERGGENWLRRSLQKVLSQGGDVQDTAGLMGLINPPDDWSPLITQNFYGRFIRSAFLKKSGTGQNRVSWTAELEEAGDYNLYFYHEGLGGGMGRSNFAGMNRGSQAPGGRQPGGGAPAGGQGQVRSNAPAGGREQGPRMAVQRLLPGSKTFIVHGPNGPEEITLDLKDARPGWNLIGRFQLPAGANTVELTDKNEERYVLADAVKWLRLK